MNESRGRYLIKNTLIFTLGNLGSKVIIFFLIPLYTNVLTTEQYGVTDLVTTIITVAVPILTLNICESVMRFGLDRDSNREQNIQIGTVVLLTGMLIGLIIIPLTSYYEPVSEYSIYIYFYVFTFASSQLYLCDLRGKEMLLQYSIGSILQTLLIALFNILFLVVLRLQIRGYLLAYILANAIVAIYAIVIGKSYRAYRFDKLNMMAIKPMVKYSVVLIPNSFMWWVMNSSDRIMVTAMIGAAANGIYAVSYKIPTLLSVCTNIFNQAWGYSAIKEDGAEDKEIFNNSILRILTSFSMLAAIVILAITKPFLSIYVNESYYEAWKYVPFLLIGSTYLTLGTFEASSYQVHKDSFGYLFSAMFGAIFNIVLNYILIPYIDVYGAAIATCVSYILVFAFRSIHTRKYIHYHVLSREFIVGTVLLTFETAAIYIDNSVGLAVQFGIALIAVIYYSRIWLPILKERLVILRREK